MRSVEPLVTDGSYAPYLRCSGGSARTGPGDPDAVHGLTSRLGYLTGERRQRWSIRAADSQTWQLVGADAER